MRRKAMVLCGGMVVAMVLNAALAAGLAHGNNMTAGAEPAELIGLDVNPEHGSLTRMTFGNGARYVECDFSVLQGLLKGPTTAVTIRPDITGCFSNGLTSAPAIFARNGCDFVFEATKTTAARTSVKCEKANEQMEIHIYENEAQLKAGKPLCTYDLKPQGPVTGIEIEHLEVGKQSEALLLEYELKMAVTSTFGGIAICGVGAAGVETTVTYAGEFAIVASDSKAKVTPLMIQ